MLARKIRIKLPHGKPDMLRGAVISKCGQYRYTLWRRWYPGLPVLIWIMLNPSTADADIDDPTIRRCIDFAKRNGFGSIVVINLFAYRATIPEDLRQVQDPIGSENNHVMLRMFESVKANGDVVVAAWGACKLKKQGTDIVALRAERVAKLAAHDGIPLYILGLTAQGKPKHPLYVSGDTPLTDWITKQPLIRSTPSLRPARPITLSGRKIHYEAQQRLRPSRGQ